MAADTDRVLTRALPIENHNNPGLFGVTSRSASSVIVVTWSGGIQGGSGSETAYLRNTGDSLTLDLTNVDTLTIESKSPTDLTTDAYPASILLLQTTSRSAVLAAAPYQSPAANGGTPFHADLTLAAVGPGATVISTPAAGFRYVVTSVIVSSDTATRVAVVDGADSAGLRVLAIPTIPAGGTVARFLGDPDGYVQAATATAMKLVVGAAGNYFVALDGYARQG